MKTKMNLSDLYERAKHGTTEFPVAFYDSHHIITYQWHEEEEIIYMVEGEADYNIEGKIIHLKAGDCAFCLGKALHSMLFEENQHVHFYAILFHRSYLFNPSDVCNQFFDTSIGMKNFFSPENNTENIFIRTVKNISELMIHQKFGYQLEVKVLLTQLYSIILQHKLYDRITTQNKEKGNSNVISTIQYIHNNYSQKLSVEELASATGYSTPYFERFFKAYTGKTPVEYILLFRLKQAQSMLRNSTGSILEISILCGFTNVSYFIRTFKKHYGVTPYQYRIQHFQKQ